MNNPPSRLPGPANDGRALMSALADGDAQALERGCESWREDADARASWHAYHLIGDVMRSEDLATAPARDAAFLAAVRSRLAAEPVVLAPAPRRRQGWVVPVAAAAGFVAVAGVMVVARISSPALDAPAVAVGPQQRAGVALVDAKAQPPQQLTIDGHVIRDARLDAYLDAHRKAAGGTSVAVPGGVPRQFDSMSPVLPAAAVPVSR
jgi:sigma-E factor negative regulatory protein RseA